MTSPDVPSRAAFACSLCPKVAGVMELVPCGTDHPDPPSPTSID